MKIFKYKILFLSALIIFAWFFLIACDNNSKEYVILTISREGTIYRSCGVNKKLGFKLNENDMVVLDE